MVQFVCWDICPEASLCKALRAVRRACLVQSFLTSWKHWRAIWGVKCKFVVTFGAHCVQLWGSKLDRGTTFQKRGKSLKKDFKEKYYKNDAKKGEFRKNGFKYDVAKRCSKMDFKGRTLRRRALQPCRVGSWRSERALSNQLGPGDTCEVSLVDPNWIFKQLSDRFGDSC